MAPGSFLKVLPCCFLAFLVQCSASEFDARIVQVIPLAQSSESPATSTNSDVIEEDGQSLPDGVAVTVRNDMQYPSHEVRLEQYRVKYSRLDVESVEGITIPRNLANSPILVVIPPNSEATFDLEIVRAAVKQQPPLASLRAGQDRIEVLAEITMFGFVRGTRQTVTFSAPHLVTFGDFGD